MEKELEEKFSGRIFKNVKASELTTYKTGGNVDWLVYPGSEEEVIWLINFVKKNNIDFFILGNGSNVLVSDNGFRGIFIGTTKLNKFNITGNKVSVDSGVNWDLFIENLVNLGLKGLEKTSYIPGSIGGAIRMNAGAFGQETFDRLTTIKVCNLKEGKVEFLKKKDLHYGYRYVKGIENYFILSGEFEFEYGSSKELKVIREDIIRKRKEKQPLEYPSAGSVFKKPKNDYASRLIDYCGLKGLKIGGAMVSTKHAGFIVNYDKASSADIYHLILKIKEEVFKKIGVELELEQILVGKF